MRRGAVAVLCVSAALAAVYAVAASGGGRAPLSPIALAPAADGKALYIACATTNQVLRLDLTTRKVTDRIAVPGPPSGLALSPDGARLYATCASPSSSIAVIDTARNRVVQTLAAGHTAGAPVLSGDGKTLFVCNRYNNDVSVFDLAQKKDLGRIPVEREPAAAALTRDGRFLLVANFLHNRRSDQDTVAATVSVIDVAQRKVVKQLRLPNGSGALEDVRVSPDGRYAAVTHVIGHFGVATSQLERGWMNTNAVSIIDVEKMEVINSVLLDTVGAGAANPWGLAWTPDSRTLVAAHAGTHAFSAIDFPALLGRLAHVPARQEPGRTPITVGSSQTQADVPNDLAFLDGIRRTIALPEGDRGPRSVAVVGNKVYTGNYFSDTLSVADLDAPSTEIESIALGAKVAPTMARKGEEFFHDGALCFQSWQTCASCHPGGARTDGLNWDLMNDGLGNPKKSKSLLYAHRTPPAMSLGVRDTAETAVRSGIVHILFTKQPESVPQAIDEYLKTLRPVPSPRLVNGKLSEAALRGRALFENAAVGCATCHTVGLFTDLKQYNVGTAGRFDKGEEPFDTPTLLEIWRTAPYLHDGSAATLLDVLTTKNAKDKHGKTSQLTRQQLDDLMEYVASL